MEFLARRSISLRVRVCALAAVAALGLASGAQAALIASWSFDDGTADDALGTYGLNAVGGGPTISGGLATFDGDEASPSFLESSGFGGNPEWSIALNIRHAAPFDQGTFQGIFSNNNSSTADYSWQLESFNGRYQFRTLSGTFDVGAPTGGFDTIVIRKVGGNDGDVWLNGVQVVTSFGHNPGGLQNFRLGANRNSNALAAFDADWVRVYNTFEDPTVIPEPGVALLLGLGLISLGYLRAPADAQPGARARR